MTDPGVVLLELAAASRREFVMCAPFAKANVVAEIVSVVPEGVRVVLYTRWRPDEVAAGVSDTEVLPMVRRHGGCVYLHDRLHAKYYRNESCTLAGSANLTSTALGWTMNPNLELLVRVNDESIKRLEKRLIFESVTATDDIALEIERIAMLLPKRSDAACSVQAIESVGEWVPSLRMPADLFLAYSRGVGSLSSTSAKRAAEDLSVLDLPAGLDEGQFKALVAHRVRGQAFFNRIDVFLSRPRRFGEVRNMIGETRSCGREEAEAIWQTTIRWIREFLPERYSYTVRRHSEMVSLAADASQGVR